MYTPMTAEQYRALDAPAFEERRQLIIGLLESEDTELDMEQVRSEKDIIVAEAQRRNDAIALRNANAAAVAQGAGIPLTGAQAIMQRSSEHKAEDADSIEYRNAFKDYVCTGKAIPAELRSNQNTLTSDVTAVIPPVLVAKILDKMESYGMILPLVNKTAFPAGMSIPVASIKPEATWVNEGASSDRQKLTASTTLTFTHFKLRCEVSISMEVSVMALEAFEAKMVEGVARAMVVAQENAILNGTGSGQPTGILTETPGAGQALTIASGAGIKYADLVAAEAAIPSEYEANAKWFMSKKSFYEFVGMVDDNKQPIARVNYGIGGKPERTLLGREVILTGSYMPDFKKVPTANTLFAFIFDMSDYTLNQNYNMGISRKQDWDTEDMLTKAVLACDGKVTDKSSLVTLTVNKAS